MSYSISINGHITGTDATAEDPNPAARIEAQLAVALHELLSQPQYGCTLASLYGQHGTVNLLASQTPEADAPDAAEGSQDE